MTETFSLSLVFVKNLSYMRRSTAPCIFGTVAKKCRGTLEELLCFCRFVRNFCGFEKMAKFLY